MTEKPVILIGSPRDMNSLGDGSANGGIKSHNLWVKLLRQHGHEAYVVTFDGSQVQWMVEHQPVLSAAQAREIVASRPTRVMTTALWSTAIFEMVDRYYFYDQELKFTADYAHQRSVLEQHLAQNRIVKLGTHSRTMQAWYMATYGLTPAFIHEWSDTDYWKPCPEKRAEGRIGYMDEGEFTEDDVRRIQEGCRAFGFQPEFVQIEGNEGRVLEQMQSCDLFLGLGRGKHPVFGEGCNRSGQEAQHAGCVVVMYDQHGNREYIHEGYTGYLGIAGHPDSLGSLVVLLLMNFAPKEATRQRSIEYAMNYFSPEWCWPQVRAFLDLSDAQFYD